MPNHDSIDATLGRVLRSGARPATGCDAEMAVAYVENRLGNKERQSFEAHMADCDACRALAATLVEELAPETVPAPASRPVWRWRWAVPALAGVLVVGSVVFYERAQLRQTESVAKPTATPAPVQPVAEERQFVPKPPTVRRTVIDAKPPKIAATPPPALAPLAPPAAAPLSTFAERDEPRDDKARPTAFGAVQAVKQKGAEDSELKAATAKALDQATDQREGARKEAAANIVSVPAPQPAAALARANLRMSPLPDAAPILSLARDGVRVWVTSTGGRIFQSTDSGRTWTPVASPTKADLVEISWEPQASLLIIKDRQGNEYRVKP